MPCGKNPKNQIKLSYKSYCYTAPLKARCYMALLKPCCYTAIFLQNLTKPKCYFDTYFIKLICYFGIYFTKSKYYFWQLIMKPNNTLAPIYKSPNIILAKTITLCSKAQNYFLAKTYLHILKSLTHGKYKLLISQKYFFYKIYGNCAYFFHNQLTIKAHVYHSWQNHSSCRDRQAQRSSTTRPSPAHMKTPATEAHLSCPVKF